jgi:hypothetical protein
LIGVSVFHNAIQLDAGRRVDLRFGAARFIRNPDGFSHAIVTREATVEDGAP